jgi:acetolactate synthase-1/2/3 large subunit
MLGADFLLDGISREGVEYLFMVPGGLIDPMLPALGRQSALTPVIAAQEGGAAYMADGYARASGKLAVAMCIGGPGLANTVTAVATAQTDSSPLFVISGEAATALEGLGLFQDASSQTLDDVSVLKPVTRFSTSVDNPKNLAHLFQRAVVHLRTPPCAPVHLSVPMDCLTATIDVRHEPLDAEITNPRLFSRSAAELTLAHFKASEEGKSPVRIAVLAGAGVEHATASAALLRFAEAWQIPVATTLRAKGVFPEDHPLSLGVFGYAGTHHARIALADQSPDLLLVLGTGLNERDSMHWTLRLSPQRAVCVNLSPMALATEIDSSSVVSDVGEYLLWLEGRKAEISASLESTRAARSQWIAGIRSQQRLQDRENCVSDAVPIHPARAVSQLRQALPRNGIVLIDSGAHRAFAGHYWESYSPLTYISATNLGPMGWAIPAAVGVQFAQPNKKVAVITGDGCMHMHGIEVSTAARYRLPIIYMVINNAALGNVWLRAHTLGPVPDQLTTLPDLDWAAFAKSLGANGISVRNPQELAPAIDAALSFAGPTVIDVKAGKQYPTPVHDWAIASAAWSYHE